MQYCVYCQQPVDGEGAGRESFFDSVCGKCVTVEIEGPATKLEFGTIAFFVRRSGSAFLEGRGANGRRFLIGRVAPNTDIDCKPERTWNWDKSEPAWTVDFVAVSDGLDSRRKHGTTPQLCVYCCNVYEAEAGEAQCVENPECSSCYSALEHSSPQVFVNKQGFQYTQRAGHWFLEGIDYRSGLNFVVGELSGPPRNWNEGPEYQRIDGSIFWNCVFVRRV